MKEDKHRENYLGNSINATKGRWQEGRDIHWYNRENNIAASGRSSRDEVRAIKQAEQEEMNRLLGIDTERTGTNAAPIDPAKRRYPTSVDESDMDDEHARRQRRHERHSRHRHHHHRHHHHHRPRHERYERDRRDRDGLIGHAREERRRNRSASPRSHGSPQRT